MEIFRILSFEKCTESSYSMHENDILRSDSDGALEVHSSLSALNGLFMLREKHKETTASIMSTSGEEELRPKLSHGAPLKRG